MQDDDYWMRHAITLARQAEQEGEVPVGALIVIENELVSEGWNRPISLNDATAHAEIQAIRSATAKIGNYRLKHATLYCTLEPCVMCAGALAWSQLKGVVFAATDPKRGFQQAGLALHPKTQLRFGVMAQEASALLEDFFAKKRK